MATYPYPKLLTNGYLPTATYLEIFATYPEILSFLLLTLTDRILPPVVYRRQDLMECWLDD